MIYERKQMKYLAHHVYSCGEKDTMIYLGSYKGIEKYKQC